MTNISLAQSYLIKAVKRLKVLEVLMAEQAYSDVIREAQEIVELSQKAMLRQVGIDPPKWHDVGSILLENSDFFPKSQRKYLKRLAEISKWLRKERELSFYGDIDFIPTEEYSVSDAKRAVRDALFTVNAAKKVIQLPR
jgi:HEPN domain-containing protein